ncbi:MAG: response regulator [Candidatus Margulisiibacteriota bacterium]
MPKQNQKILIIEDHPVTSQMIANILKMEGINVMVAADGKTGIAKAKAEPPNLILLDIMMPEMDGFEVCAKLKSDPETAKTPIVIVSVCDSGDSIKKGKDLGADGYIAKPFDPEELVKIIRKYI